MAKTSNKREPNSLSMKYLKSKKVVRISNIDLKAESKARYEEMMAPMHQHKLKLFIEAILDGLAEREDALKLIKKFLFPNELSADEQKT